MFKNLELNVFKRHICKIKIGGYFKKLTFFVNNYCDNKITRYIIKARKELDMSIKINGTTWYYVDTVYDDDLVYDIYENVLGEHIYKVVCSLY